MRRRIEEDQKFLDAAGSVPSVNITTYYEVENKPQLDDYPKMKDWLILMVTKWLQHPDRILTTSDGMRPIVFVYNPGNTQCAKLDLWKQALDEVQGVYHVRPVLVVDMADNLQTRCTNHSSRDFIWHEYAPPPSEGYTETWAYHKRQTITIRPGFWRHSGRQAQQQRRLTDWQSKVNWANNRHAQHFQLITSWNEWLEMSSVEPGVEWWSSSGLGSYLDILAQFPPQ